jgi:predicted RNA-binding Zn-ribbon protein involved in translation (DUF1610 family)
MPLEMGQSEKIRLGGCIIKDDNPEWYCKACRYEWQTDHPEDGRFTCAECGEIEEDCICAPMEELSVDKCPGCNSEKIFKLKWMPYNEQTYRCKNASLHGIKTQDIATFVRMSLYTVNAMRICLKWGK